MPNQWLDFEKPIVELERKIEELKAVNPDGHPRFAQELARLEAQADKLRHGIYTNLNRWQRVQLARHPNRPYTLDYIRLMVEGFIELHGDRCFRDDHAIVAGLGKLGSHSVVIVGHQKGRDTKEKLTRNFGMPHPEGYRKALRVMQLAAKFGKPVVSLVDTPGAYPGVGAEERGQSEAIARNLREMAVLSVPIVTIITGEGGSGGALAIAVADRVLMMENAIYSVISPEGCASILWRDAGKAPQAAEALRPTARDLLGLGIIDDIVPEPTGGAHRDHEEAAREVKRYIIQALDELVSIEPETLVRNRILKFSRMGGYAESANST
jgi:acetyl-CoA carboxylase carboxyl transferase subunit alpha